MEIFRPPTFAGDIIQEMLRSQYGIDGNLMPLVSYSDQNFLVEQPDGQKNIVKVANPAVPWAELEMQNAAMSHLSESGLAVPIVLPNCAGEEITEIQDHDGRAHGLRVLTYIAGQFYVDAEPHRHSGPLWRDLGRFLGKVDAALASFNHKGAYRSLDWDLAHGYAVCQQKKRYLDRKALQLVDHFLSQHRAHTMPLLLRLPMSVIHNDANDHNILIDDADAPCSIVGLIDFGDMVHTYTVNELAIAAAYAMMGQTEPVETLKVLAASYHADRPLNGAEIEVLYNLIGLRLCTTLCNAAAELAAQPENSYVEVSVEPARELLTKWRRLPPFAVECQLRVACGVPLDAGKAKSKIIAFRKKHLGKTLSLSYQQPLKLVRGSGAYLYDEQGNDYLDMVNNVCHVGHCHPAVVSAGQEQMAKLNTNTRFLHDNLVDYAERLLATMPARLSVCMLVNSGSEANELAFRLARTYTDSKQLLVVDGAYHGNTSACIDASPYKFDGSGGKGASPHVHKVPLPDPYRGDHLGMSKTTGRAYATTVAGAIDNMKHKGLRPGAFICESLQGVAGQIIMPDGYLEAAYPLVRDAGGVCIADEVQVGFGRVGSHMWAFETQGVVPDIVTLGKPIGNGHPLAAVITTQEIADGFVTGMEYFNTFGGNPVSCAIGKAVLDVIEAEGLQQNALATGEYLQRRLKEMQVRMPLIGDVRGLGLFIGVELVSDGKSKTPATEIAAEIIEQMKARRVILSTEGPFHNVLKIKPPIVFSLSEADRFVDALGSSFEAVA